VLLNVPVNELFNCKLIDEPVAAVNTGCVDSCKIGERLSLLLFR
jgi:hypothetical protein